ncbi:MAG TPA: glycosyltransferase family 87 protein [Gemmataceae bacterium]|nr:glycosyltransferase family 87 protein [Gemmataceae bacterium]
MGSGKTPGWLMRTALIAVWVVVLVCLFLNAARRVGGDTGDFVHFYEAARAMLHGEDLYSSGRGGYIYPPLLAFLYTPVAVLPPNAAAVVLLLCNMVLMLASVLLAAREFARRFGIRTDAWKTLAVALAASLLVGDKLKGELQMWQTNLLMLFLFTAALALLDRRPILAGMVLGVAFNIKYLPIVFLPYLLLRRRWTAAAAFAASIVGFALLPAVLTGWGANLHNQTIAYSGLFRLMGVPVGTARAANIHGIAADFSVSIPSGVARSVGAGDSAGLALAAAGVVALAAAAVAGWMYRRNDVPFLYRPDSLYTCPGPINAIAGLEWAVLVAAALVFSPQTNTRHLSLLLIVQTPAVLLLSSPAPGVSRRPLLFGTAVLVFGLLFPPGTQDFIQVIGIWFAGPLEVWRSVGGPCWCALAMLGALIWTGLPYARSLNAALVAPGADATRLVSLSRRGAAA